jgi:hypothetical protein
VISGKREKVEKGEGRESLSAFDVKTHQTVQKITIRTNEKPQQRLALCKSVLEEEGEKGQKKKEQQEGEGF